nr:MAG TPA: hypothetical protein [Caudoviricetes sp.]
MHYLNNCCIIIMYLRILCILFKYKRSIPERSPVFRDFHGASEADKLRGAFSYFSSSI